MDVKEEPLLSIGRGFSAPANFKLALDRKARAALMGHDSDAFNRWESGQVLATDVLLGMAEPRKAAESPRRTRSISTPSAKCSRARKTIPPLPRSC